MEGVGRAVFEGTGRAAYAGNPCIQHTFIFIRNIMQPGLTSCSYPAISCRLFYQHALYGDISFLEFLFLCLSAGRLSTAHCVGVGLG